MLDTAKRWHTAVGRRWPSVSRLPFFFTRCDERGGRGTLPGEHTEVILEPTQPRAPQGRTGWDVPPSQSPHWAGRAGGVEGGKEAEVYRKTQLQAGGVNPESPASWAPWRQVLPSLLQDLGKSR